MEVVTRRKPLSMEVVTRRKPLAHGGGDQAEAAAHEGGNQVEAVIEAAFDLEEFVVNTGGVRLDWQVDCDGEVNCNSRVAGDVIDEVAIAAKLGSFHVLHSCNGAIMRRICVISVSTSGHPSTSASTYLEDENGRGWPYCPNLARLDRVSGGIVSIISDIHIPFRRLEESMAEFCLIAIFVSPCVLVSFAWTCLHLLMAC